MKEGRNVQIIEWQDLNKKKFFGLGLVMSGVLRFTIYPTNLVKTRLQAQEGKTAYKGLFDAFKQIARNEGFRGFYKGFPISLLQVVAGQFYISTYELSKQKLFSEQSISVQHLLGGFMASTASQTIMVPVDVISQHQQILGSGHKMSVVDIKSAKSKSKTYRAQSTKATNMIGQSFHIAKQICQNEGIRGLYRGYLVSLSTYGSNSALYWSFYYLYSEFVEEILPKSDNTLREPFRIVSSGILSSITAVVITNPLDVVRTRYQLQVKNEGDYASAWKTFRSLVESEGYGGLKRGLTARITSSSLNSGVIILMYEYLKKMSVKTDHSPHKGKLSKNVDSNVAVAAN